MSRTDRFYSAAPSNSGDERAAARKDRDRILYSSAFRRLSGITQVVAPNERFPVHNRLTHSLKVAQVGRSIAERLIFRFPNLAVYLDPEVVEAACLAHDLGHPPFGHNTEKELDRLLTNKLDSHDELVPDGFEGNAQTFRVVTRLSVRYLESTQPGLNLTRATLNAILKYPWGRSTEGKHATKYGYYSSEEEQFQFARAESIAQGQSIEAALMDWADDVTYGVHDVEDFFRAGLLPLERLVKADDEVERERFVDWMTNRQTGPEGYSRSEIEQTLDPFRIGVPGPFRGTRSDRAALRTFTSLLINEFVQAVGVETSDQSVPVLTISRDIKARVAVLKALTTFYVIESPSLLAQRYGQRRIVRTLFEIFYEAATDKHRDDLAIFPLIFRERLELLPVDDRKQIKRLISDLISSMSEGQLLDTFAKLTGQIQGSAVEPIA
jgi:dGTPase